MINIINFYNWTVDSYNDLVIFIEVFIALTTLYLIGFCFINSHWIQTINHWTRLELIWTIFPAIILGFLGIPRLKILYFIEIFNFSRHLTVKVMGQQWYWDYSFPEFIVNLSSYPKALSSLFRIGERSFLCIPINCKIRILISSQDVLHSWSLPSIGLKIDACPGRLNFFTIIVARPGKHVGQCRELCGNYHSWIPIFLEATSIRLFFDWMKLQL